MNHDIQYLTLGELFSGPGGLALGAMCAQSDNGQASLRIKHAWANDYDADTCKTYQKNICTSEANSLVIHKDVRQLNLLDLPPVDIFAYGFPCNDFSIVGEHKGFKGTFGPLYQYGVQILNQQKPKVFVAENVGGIASANEGKAFKTILRDLETAGNGYNLTVHLYKAEEYGVAQTRHRYVIVGIDRTLGLRFRVPKPTHRGNHVAVKTVLSNIPNQVTHHDYAKTAQHVIERLRHIKPGQNAWTADLPEHLRLNVKSAKMSQIYKRLHPDLPSYTITGSGGGGTHGYHYEEHRPLTNRERARIQSFPDDFEFIGSRESVRKQIGMAVPPKLSEIIFSAILDTLNGVKYPYVEANYVYSSEHNQANLPLFDTLYA